MSTPSPVPPDPPVVTRAGVVLGLRDTIVVSAFIFPFGMAFGAAAVEKGVAALHAILLSGLVFAGAAQFAALDLWLAPLPLVPIVLVTIAVNARYMLFGASIAPWLLGLPPGKRYLLLTLLTDINWVNAMQRRAQGCNDAGVVLGAGIGLWIAWMSGTLVGFVLGADGGDLSRFGLDVVMVTFFAAMLMSQVKLEHDLWPWLAAGAVALGASYVLPAGWHVLAGALAGGAVGAWRHGR